MLIQFIFSLVWLKYCFDFLAQQWISYFHILCECHKHKLFFFQSNIYCPNSQETREQ